MNHDSRQVDHSTGTFRASDGTQLFEQWWQPVAETKAVLVIVHGIAEHSGRYAYVANYMGGHGYAVATFDLRGHGHSEGDRAYVRSFDEYLSDLDQFLARVREQEPGKAIFLLGHSMGGTIIALFAITRQPGLAGLILSAAAVKLSEDNRLSGASHPNCPRSSWTAR